MWLGPLAFESSFVGFKAFLAHFEASCLGVGRGIGDPCVVLVGVCRDPARPHTSLSSPIEPYVRSPLPTPEEP